MTEQLSQPALQPIPLSRELAEQHADTLAALADQIPGVEYTAADILAESKGERQMYSKWDHSLIIIDGDKPVAFIMGYERTAEGNDQYPANTIYISELAVAADKQQQGIGSSLLRAFFEHNNQVGFRTLAGELNYSIQTNSADWNEHVVELYKSFGFTQRSTKQYPNRTDVVLSVDAGGLNLQ